MSEKKEEKKPEVKGKKAPKAKATVRRINKKSGGDE